MTNIANSINRIENYTSIIRNVIFRKSSIEVKESDSFNEIMAEKLQIKARQFPKVLSALDIIGDADEAIINFEEYGLNGSSKDIQTGEKYLRLYGILNTLNIHKEAILALASVFDIKNNLRKDDSINIFNIRSKLAGHSTSHTSKENSPQAFAPIRMTINHKTLSFMNMDPQSNEVETIDLNQEIEVYINIAEQILKETTIKISGVEVFEKNDEDNKTNLEQIRKFEELCIQLGIKEN